MTLFTVAMAVTCSPDSSTKRFSGWHSEIKPIVNQLVEAKENENALVILPEYFDKQFTYYLDEDHEIFRTQSQPTNYYVFQDYLLKQGYYYDYNYQKADFDKYDKVAFPYHETITINELIKYLESIGLHPDKELNENHYSVYYFVK